MTARIFSARVCCIVWLYGPSLLYKLTSAVAVVRILLASESSLEQ